MKLTQASSGRAPRREFLKKTAVATVAVAATPLFKATVYGQAPAAGKVVGANDRITVASIGVGAQGMNAHVNLLTAHASENNIAFAAVCDVWPKRAAAAKEFIEKGSAGAKVETYGDYQKLLERKDIDAVVVATHDPMHARATIAALEAGKHVYCEKPMTRYLDEAFAVEDAVKRTRKILQVGSQGCSALAWHKAAELILAQKIGELIWAQGYYCRNSIEGEWNKTVVDEKEMTAAAIDWDKWLGPVSKRPFDAESYARWRKFYPFCAGLLGDLMPHRLHPLMLAMGKPEFPSRVVAIGTKNVHADKNTPGARERDVPEHIELLVEFPSGVSLMLACSTVNATSPEFAIYGHKATLKIGSVGERLQLVPERPFADEIDVETLEGLKPTEAIEVHHKDWFDSIRANKQPNCGIDLAVRVQTVVSLAEMSDRLKVACVFDEKTRKVTTGDGKEIKPISYGTLPLS